MSSNTSQITGQKPIIAATGLSGLVGSRIVELLSDQFEFLSLHQQMLDITDKKLTEQVISQQNFDYFLHLAAYTNVDQAEINRQLAWDINFEGTKNVFNAVKNHAEMRGARPQFIQISTDFVFDGTAEWYDENSPLSPISYYGETKAEAERYLKDKAMIVRIAYPYRSQYAEKKDLVRSILSLLENKTPFAGITDQVLTPTFIDDIAYALGHLVKNFDNSIYHIVGGSSVTGYNLIKTIGEIFEIDTSHVSEISYDEFYKGKAPRPRKNIIKSVNNTFWPMKPLPEGLQQMKNQIAEI